MEDITMKKYIKPICETIELNVQSGILASSGGVTDGSKVGQGFTSTDVSYGHDDDNDW